MSTRAVAPSNQWAEPRPERIAARTLRAYFVEHADGYLTVTDDPDLATHAWALWNGKQIVVPYRSDSRMVEGFGSDTLVATVVPDVSDDFPLIYMPGLRPSGFTHTRAGAATQVRPDGTIVSVASGVLRSAHWTEG